MRRIVGLAAVLVLLLTLLSQELHADLIVTLEDDGSGGVIASFEGSGFISGTGDRAIWRDLDGDYTDPEPFLFSLASPVSFAPGITFISLQLDDDGAGPNLDDFALDFSGVVTSGTAYSVSGSTSVLGLSFALLNPGVYTPTSEQQVAFGGATLIIGSGMTDLGFHPQLGGGPSINNSQQVASNRVTGPVTGPEVQWLIWENGTISDLGVFGATYGINSMTLARSWEGTRIPIWVPFGMAGS